MTDQPDVNESDIIDLGTVSVVTRGAGGNGEDGFNQRKNGLGLTED